MKIYTKTGDQGQTSLLGGSRVNKYNIRIESYGTVDELNSYIGIIRSSEISQKQKEALIEIQNKLFTIGSQLATEPGKENANLPLIQDEDITFLEKGIDNMDSSLPPMKNFVLPGGHPVVAHCHVARCICRRAERLVTHLNDESMVPAIILIYLNRLSDYLFILSRKISDDLSAEEIPWRSRK